MKGLLVIAIAIVAAGCIESKAGFQRVGGHALTHFVVVDPSRIADSALYERAVARVCRGQTLHCSVLFWADTSLAARTLPMTDEEATAVVASYRFHRPTASRGFGCHPFGGPQDRCDWFDPDERAAARTSPAVPGRIRVGRDG